MAEIAHRIGAGVLRTSVELTRSQPLPQVESHALFTTALDYMHQHRLRTFSLSREILETLAARHPRNATLRAWLGMWYLLRQAQGLGSPGGDDLGEARKQTRRALTIDPDCPLSLTVDGMTGSHHAHDFDEARERFDRAVEYDPNNACAYDVFASAVFHRRRRAGRASCGTSPDFVAARSTGLFLSDYARHGAFRGG